MAIRIRKNGRIFCAAMFPEEPGDTYINDQLHYHLSVEENVLVAEPHERHKISGEWWKPCRKCGELKKVVTDFYKRKSGISPWCKSCCVRNAVENKRKRKLAATN